MVIVACIDKLGNITADANRQINDILFIKRLWETTNEALLFINDCSRKKFFYYPMMYIDDNFLDQAEAEDYCFVENTDITPYVDRIDKIILYKWNKTFSSELKFDVSILKDYKIVSKESFLGSFHLRITEVIYEKNN